MSKRKLPPFVYWPGFVCTKCSKPAVDGCEWCGIGRCKRHRYQKHDACEHPAPTPRRRK